MKVADIILNILWLLLGLAIMIFIVFTAIQGHIAGMIMALSLLVVYIIDTATMWR